MKKILLTLLFAAALLSLQAQKLYSTTHIGGTNNTGAIIKLDVPTNTLSVPFSFDKQDAESPGHITLVKAPNGKLYGITGDGGTYDNGTIFSFDPATATYSVVFNFHEHDGEPIGTLLLYDGLLYGVTDDGGENEEGTIFSFNPVGDKFTKLFDFDGDNGSEPLGGLTLYGDKLYGTTYDGGTEDYGVIYSFDPDNKTYEKLHDFDYNNGASVNRRLCLYNGKLYGHSYYGGANSRGIIFSYEPGTDHFENVHDFDSDMTDASTEFTEYGGKLYCVTIFGGNNDNGFIFSYDPDTDTYAKLYDFDFENGANPESVLYVYEGKLYGTTADGGAHEEGVIFSFDPGDNTYQKLHDFDEDNGSDAEGSLVLIDGLFYSTTENGGNSGNGILYSFDPVTPLFTKLYDFGTNASGNTPQAPMIQGTDGKLYGTTFDGGYRGGVIFSFDPATDTHTTLHNFKFSDGIEPAGGLTLYNGKFYGLTTYGGNNFVGTLFSFDPETKTFEKLHDFVEGDGYYFVGSLTVYDGKLYGVANEGGSNWAGTLFSFDPADKQFEKLYDFSYDNSGYFPSTGLTVYNDKLYGVTGSGGDEGDGVIFSFEPGLKTYNKLFNFNPSDGQYPESSLTLHNGKFYGMTGYGGTGTAGTLFSYSPDENIFTKLYDFDEINGGYPENNLALGSDGKLYGLLGHGGSESQGIVFSYDPDNASFSKLHDFDGTNGAQPRRTAFVELVCTEKTWYADTDGDGFGNLGDTKLACEKPDGYVADNTDCDDTKALYADSDGDGFGAGPKAACGVDSNTDCNDNDEDEKPGQTWYIDSDGDGYTVAMLMGVKPSLTVSMAAVANPGVVVQCERPLGGKLESELSGYGDCNDNDNTAWQSATLYVDNDNDTYTTGDGQVVCYGENIPAGYSTTQKGDDCNDNDGAINPGATEVCDNVDNDCDGDVDEGVGDTYYRDADGDGFGNAGSTTQSCDGLAPDGYVANSDDCNDNDEDEKPGQTWYIDADGDGYTVTMLQGRIPSLAVTALPSGVVVSCTRPDGGKLESELAGYGDCDDNDGEVYQSRTLYRDSDNDTYTVGTGQPFCYGATLPAGYRATKSSTDDCNDASASVWRTGTFYTDSDGDTYTVGEGLPICYGSTTPSGFTATKSTTDDCNDGNAQVWRTALLYIDSDGDTYTIGNGQSICYGAAIPSGYRTTKSTSDDCNDGNAAIWRSALFYTDSDGDTYTVGDGLTICYGATAPSGYRTTKSATDDCADGNAARNPGAAEICNNGVDDNCNGIVDEGCAKFIKVNLFGGVNPYTNIEWNNWNVSGSTNITSSPYRYSDGTTSSVSGLLNNSQGLSDNGATYGGTMAPAEVLRYASFSTVTRTLTLRGLNNALTYDLELYASRSNTGNTTQFTINGVTRQVVTDNNKNNKVLFANLVPVNGQIVIAINRVGSFTYLNGFMLTEKTTATESNQAPVAKAGGPTTITLPTDEITANGSASSDPDGTIATYQWSQVTGPSTALIAAPSSPQTQVSNLVQGRYKFLLTVTDNNGAIGNDTLFVTVNPEPGVTTRSLRVNLFGGVNPFANAAWNNWNVSGSTNITSAPYKYSDGGTSNISGLLSGSNGISDNGATYGGVMAPPEVLRYASFSTSRRTLTLRGLNNALTYDLELYASRSNTGNSTQFTIGSVTRSVVSDNNKTMKVEFTGLVPVNGQIVITINRVGSFNYLNGFILTEKTPVSFTEQPLVVSRPQQQSNKEEAVSTKASITLSAYPNPFSAQVLLQYTVQKKARVSISLFDPAGREVAQVYQGEREPGTYTVTYPAQRLAQGAYYCRMITLDTKGGQQKESIKLVKAQ